MNRLLAPYFSSEFVYNFAGDPRNVKSKDEAVKIGNNCEWLAHELVREFTGHVLPSDLLSYEMATCPDLINVSGSRVEPGDLVFFGDPSIGLSNEFSPRYDSSGNLTNWQEWPVNHVGVATGRSKWHKDYLVAHASAAHGTNIIEPLSAITRIPSYPKVYGVRRLRLLSAPEPSAALAA
ncbi:MAG TPA: hypothetical protein VLG27_04590 [Candidatus Saccharimonadia bacterium]|nr:hypothetical protein [Candidatus Saccharimonadia bacterium]